MSPYIPIQLQRTIRQHFKNRCAYCQTSEALIATRFEMDHIQPRSTGGELTASGRVTLEVLEINRPALVHLRKLWRKFGEHPPQE